MAKRRYRRVRRYFARAKRSASKMTIPVAVAGGLVGTIAIRQAIDQASKGQFVTAAKQFSIFAGIYPDSGVFSWQLAVDNAKPLVTGILIHKLASMAGVNKYLAKSKIPILRV